MKGKREIRKVSGRCVRIGLIYKDCIYIYIYIYMVIYLESLELWRMRNIPLLPSLPPDRILSMGQIELFDI